MASDAYKQELRERAEDATGLNVVELQVAGQTVFVLEPAEEGRVDQDLLDDAIHALVQEFPEGELFDQHTGRTDGGERIQAIFRGLEKE